MRTISLLLVACCATTAVPRSPAVDGRTLVGVEWITPPSPWRTATPALAFAIVGDVAVVTGWRGWIGAIDLKTGAVLRESWIDGTFWDLVRLADGRLLALGERADESLALTVDPATLRATPLTLPGAPARWRRANVTVLRDGGVVLTGDELPLAIYDPQTWLERRVVDARTGWGQVVEVGEALLAIRGDNVVRVELATGNVTTIGLAHRFAAAGNVVVRSVLEREQVEVEIDGTVRHVIPGIDMGVALDEHATRLLVHANHDEVEVYELPSGNKLRTLTLGQPGSVVRGMQLAGSRAIAISNSMLRILDLASGTVTPAFTGPFGRPHSLAVSNTGEVGVVGSSVWRLVRGKVEATHALNEPWNEIWVRLTPPPGEVHRFAIMNDKHATITDGQPRRRVDLQPLGYWYPGWFAGDEVVLGVGNRERSHVMRSAGDDLVRVIDHHSEAELADVDIAGGRALITWRGTAHVVALRDGERLAAVAIPSCEGRAELEPGGRRIATSDAHTVTLWTGAASVSTRFDDEVARVAFLPNSDDVVVVLHHHLALWSPASGELRSIGVSSIFELAVSPDGRRLALGFGDDRIAVLDVAAFRAGLGIERAPVAPPPPACPPADPFAHGSS